MMRAYNARPIPAGDNSRLGIPGIRFSDGPRGVVMNHSTCFPVSMARGATWDVDLEARVGDAMGVEARSLGGNILAAVCINLLRHPAWGRAQETYGEDPFHLGEMGAALVSGIQRHVMACVKHYACNSIENTRMKVDVRIGERALREMYLRHFKRCVDAGAASVMTAYNKVNGAYCGHNVRLVREILKDEWGFDGFVMSDFMFGIRDAGSAALAGLDLEMPFRWHYANNLKKLVEAGELREAVVDEAVMRILRQKIRFAQVGEPGRYGEDQVASESHRALAREVAQKSIVLLRNEPPRSGEPRVLPLDARRLERLAVVGRLAAEPNIGDSGSSKTRPPHVVTPLEGIRAALEGNTALIQETSGKPQAAADAARAADAAIVVVGYTAKDEGEHLNMFGHKTGGDRVSLYLSPEDEALIQAVASVNPRTIVVLMGGSAIIVERWSGRVPGILMAWYPGMEGGHALVDILFGAVNPSGKLPCVFPRSASHLPPFDPRADAVDYGYWHGYRLLDRDNHEPAFAFGYGLSFTTFEYANLALSAETVALSGSITASVDVTNTGDRSGDEVVQLYVAYPEAAVERPVRELKAFVRVPLAPGETRRVALTAPARRLAYWDEDRNRWWVETVRHTLCVGSSSRASDLLTADFRVTDE
jgi:beta-glucosidase